MPSADRFFCAIRFVSHPFVLAWQKNTTFLSCPAVCPFVGPQSSFCFCYPICIIQEHKKFPARVLFSQTGNRTSNFLRGGIQFFAQKRPTQPLLHPERPCQPFLFSEFITSLRGQTVPLPLPQLPCCQKQRGCRALRPCRGLPPSLSAPLRPRRTAPCGPPPASRR